MKIKQNKGLTLMELLIAVALITVVMGIGYKVFDKVQILPSKQASNSDIQNGMNRVRDFMSKELKYCDAIDLEYKKGNNLIIQPIDESNEGDKNAIADSEKYISNAIKSMDEYKYNYTVKTGESNNKNLNNSDKVVYEVNIYTKNNTKYYSISKIDELGVKMELIERQKVSDNVLPMVIKNVKSMYDVKVNYLDNREKVYNFEIYNGLDSESSDGNIDPPIPPALGGGSDLIRECIIQSKMMLDQISIEDKSGKLTEAVQEYTKLANYMIDNFDYLLSNKGEFNRRLNELNGKLEDLEDATDNYQGNRDMDEYAELTEDYIDKASYILNNQYYESPPELTKDIIVGLSSHSGEEDEHVSFKSIDDDLTEVLAEEMLEPLKKFCLTNGQMELSSIQLKIASLQQDVRSVNLNYVMPMYHPYLDPSQEKRSNLADQIDDLVSKFENYRDNDINNLLAMKNGKYIYIKNGKEEEAKTLIKNAKQNVKVVIEELKYIKWIIGE